MAPVVCRSLVVAVVGRTSSSVEDRPLLAAAATPEGSPNWQSTNGCWRGAARAVRLTCGSSRSAAGSLLAEPTLRDETSDYTIAIHLTKRHSPSRCTGLSGLGVRASIALVSSWLKRSSRVIVSIMVRCLICMNCAFSSLRCSLQVRSCTWLSIDRSPCSGIWGSGSAGVAGWDGGGLGLLYSRCTRACREARLLISRKPTRSPRLKLPFPCLNSHMAVSGAP